MEDTLREDLKIRKQEAYKLFDQIAGTYDFLNHFLSFGIDTYWRKKFLKNLPLRNNLQVIDLACGTGDVGIVLSKDKRVQKITGIDLSQKMIDVGNKKIEKKNLQSKIELKIGDGVKIPYPDNSVDVVTISFGIRNFTSALESLIDIRRVLKPNGKVLIMELSVPRNFIVKFFYLLFFRHILPMVGNLVSGHGDAYTYLNETVEDFPCGKNFVALLDEAGFKNTNYNELTFGISTLYSGENC